ncbi:hypothetical protein [Mycoplasma todarodis]|uniref:hypothetical protein n=1 Tax=Mycoplasma todarodis TaxID=1937191 RepID=UPI003B361E53
MKNKKTIYRKTGRGGDYFVEALNEKDIDINCLLQTIEQNVGSKNPLDTFNPLNFFGDRNMPKERFRVI